MASISALQVGIVSMSALQVGIVSMYALQVGIVSMYALQVGIVSMSAPHWHCMYLVNIVHTSGMHAHVRMYTTMLL